MYVLCFNIDFWYINKVVYGKKNYIRKCNVLSFFVNIKLGIGKLFIFIVYSIMYVFFDVLLYIG